MTTTQTLATLVETARSSTGADMALLLAPGAGGMLEVVASAGVVEAAAPINPAESYAGLVLSSQQPIAMQAGPDDDRTVAEGRLLGRRPTAVCCVPCVGADDVTGVLELIDKAGGSFDFDDVEIASMLAEVAGAALDERGTSIDVPSPESLASMLGDLARTDEQRYRRVAQLVEMILAAG